MIAPARKFSCLSMPSSRILAQSNPAGTSGSIGLRTNLYFCCACAENAPKPSSARKTPTRMTNKLIKTRTLKNPPSPRLGRTGADAEVECFFMVELHLKCTILDRNNSNNQSFLCCGLDVAVVSLGTKKIAQLPNKWLLRNGLAGNTSWRRPIVDVINWIDPPHRLLASLFFDHVRHEAGRSGDHENAVERRRVHTQIGENGANSAIHVDGQGFLCFGERPFNGARRFHVLAIHTRFARQ